jgi:hypothetical protein
MFAPDRNQKPRCTTTTHGGFISGIGSRNARLPHFVHMAAT